MQVTAALPERSSAIEEAIQPRGSTCGRLARSIALAWLVDHREPLAQVDVAHLLRPAVLENDAQVELATRRLGHRQVPYGTGGDGAVHDVLAPLVRTGLLDVDGPD